MGDGRSQLRHHSGQKLICALYGGSIGAEDKEKVEKTDLFKTLPPCPKR
jgi:hypothetical protein